MHTGSANHLLPWWAWLIAALVLLVAELVIQALARAGRIPSDSVWVKRTSRKRMGMYVAFRVGALALVVIVVLAIEVARH